MARLQHTMRTMCAHARTWQLDALDAAVQAEMAHPAMAGADPLIDSLYAQLEGPAAEGAQPASTAGTGLTADGGLGFLGSKTADTLAELEADRRLIAAAPELLEALQVVVADWTAQFERNGHLAPAWCRQARAAIAKATGAAA